MKEAGAVVFILGQGFGPEEVHSKYGHPTKMEMRTKDADPEKFDAVIIPVGYAPDLLRRCASSLEFVRSLAGTGKVAAAICHAGWVLISADVIKGKRATSFFHQGRHGKCRGQLGG